MNSTQTSLGDLIVFGILSGAVLAGSIFTITRRNPIAAVMSLVATFFALAGIYASLSAHFIAVLQVSVYAGAIMVLFVFVVMILNREEIEPVSFRGIITRAFGVLAVGYAALVLARIAWAGRGDGVLASTGQDLPAFGTVAAVGSTLFREFVLPFEAISLLLLIAIVGSVIVSRSHQQEAEAQETARRDAATRAAITDERRLGVGPLADVHAEAGASDHGHAHH